MTAYGYIRKSVVHDPARELSPAMQEGAIRALAARHGDEQVVILSDLDVSGKKDRTQRRGWDELLTAVETSEATAVYAYSLSRFARSVFQLSGFFETCARLRVPVRVDRDAIDTSTASGKLVTNMLSSIAQFESDVASERVLDAFASKRRRDPSWRGPGNLNYGELEGEDTAPVVEAFRDAGSFDGAARLLNDRGIPTRGKGRAVWHGTSVAAVVRRVAEDEVAPATSRGVKAGKRDFRLARVLVCGTCGTRLTASLDKRQNLVRYYCHRAKVTPHARGWVTEPKVLRQVAAEAEHAAVRIRQLMVGSADDQAARDALGAKRARIIDMAADGVIDKADRDLRIAEVAEQESRLSARRAIKRITIPPDIEQGNPVAVNRYLSTLFDGIVVDMSKVARPGPSQPALTLDFNWRDEALRMEAVATA
jgi:DNA invertase Pin-like site-specific DNA recombinase